MVSAQGLDLNDLPTCLPLAPHDAPESDGDADSERDGEGPFEPAQHAGLHMSRIRYHCGRRKVNTLQLDALLSVTRAKLEREWAELGLGWEEVIEQRARELRFMASLERKYGVRFGHAKGSAP